MATATRWYGTARMPRALTAAGFEVVLFAPRNTLAEHSRFVAHVEHLADGTTPRKWFDAFVGVVDKWTPRLVVPCDDLAFRLLGMLALTPPDDVRPARRLELSLLIERSLGNPEHYRQSVDKLLLPRVAEALGIPMPPSIVAADVDEAAAFAAIHGYPVVLKRSHSSGGDGVEICSGYDSMADAFIRLRQSIGFSLGDSSAEGVLVQKHIDGRVLAHPFLAWRGRLLTGYGGERMAVGPENKGPITVNRYHHNPELYAESIKLAAGFGITGIAVPEFIIEDRTGEVYLLEVNRRLVGGAHRGSDFNVDHAAALYAALHGAAIPTRARLDDDEEHLSVHFPQEWLRDPQSHWLRDYPVDVPWDDPGLLQAMAALGDQL